MNESLPEGEMGLQGDHSVFPGGCLAWCGSLWRRRRPVGRTTWQWRLSEIRRSLAVARFAPPSLSGRERWGWEGIAHCSILPAIVWPGLAMENMRDEGRGLLWIRASLVERGEIETPGRAIKIFWAGQDIRNFLG
eukprot:TRINITY_DN7563_c0_g3_i1.p2 TRINITY_DN7563_c0_g3~~TRINITY_DN7563_c0_g3_i1.p2  ORF type:complete len:135 (+),score=11.25 TRINITY_DN7563_c0_g3_i1:868-1272(+)